MPRPLRSIVLVAMLVASARGASADPFELVDGDRVVLLGSTLIEREQSSGYWETLLTTRFPDRNIVFRNLGWSGDTVFAEARAGFGTAADGFRELREHVAALRPTVIFACYGANESFAGEAGLARFKSGLAVLLDALSETKARLVVASPLPHETLGPPLPDAAARNRDLALYRDAISAAARERSLRFVDLFAIARERRDQHGPPLTDNGIHLTEYGYWATAPLLAEGLAWPPVERRLDVQARRPVVSARGIAAEAPQAQRLSLAASWGQLPRPPMPPAFGAHAAPPAAEAVLAFAGLASGRYRLSVDGETVAAARDREWSTGQPIHTGPDFDQVEQLRQAIIAKNRLYFHRWRPQNVTYLFGFRKHEQGQNAKEVADFDPLIAQAEARIAELRAPLKRQYELIPEDEAHR